MTCNLKALIKQNVSQKLEIELLISMKWKANMTLMHAIAILSIQKTY
jgi:hypothetical protein